LVWRPIALKNGIVGKSQTMAKDQWEFWERIGKQKTLQNKKTINSKQISAAQHNGSKIKTDGGVISAVNAEIVRYDL